MSTDSFRDREGRCIRTAALGAGLPDDEREALSEMYERFDTADRAQGLPPVEETALEEWLDRILEGTSVLAWDEDRVVGHAGLYPLEADRHELIIFIDGAYQGAGIGSALLSNLLEAYAEHGGGAVRLSVEPTNEAAINLYRKFGFAVETETALEIQMRREL